MNKDEQEMLAKQLWTIGDSNRLRLLKLLPSCPEGKNPMNVSRLATELNLSQPTVSNHLARLRTLGIVHHQRKSRDVFYCIDQEVAAQILRHLAIALKTQEHASGE